MDRLNVRKMLRSKTLKEFRDKFCDPLITERVTKMRRKRGRPPIHKKAMTAAERQARRREKVRREEKERRYRLGDHGDALRPPYGYQAAKDQMIHEGHVFERTRREWGFEEGVFVDGAMLSGSEIIKLAKLPIAERKSRIAEARTMMKNQACFAVECYMERLHVTFEELSTYIESQQKRHGLCPDVYTFWGHQDAP
jgi:hypothetical protein